MLDRMPDSVLCSQELRGAVKQKSHVKAGGLMRLAEALLPALPKDNMPFCAYCLYTAV